MLMPAIYIRARLLMPDTFILVIVSHIVSYFIFFLIAGDRSPSRSTTFTSLPGKEPHTPSSSNTRWEQQWPRRRWKNKPSRMRLNMESLKEKYPWHNHRRSLGPQIFQRVDEQGGLLHAVLLVPCSAHSDLPMLLESSKPTMGLIN